MILGLNEECVWGFRHDSNSLRREDAKKRLSLIGCSYSLDERERSELKVELRLNQSSERFLEI